MFNLNTFIFEFKKYCNIYSYQLLEQINFIQNFPIFLIASETRVFSVENDGVARETLMDERDEVVTDVRERHAPRINERLFLNTRCFIRRAYILHTHFPRFVSVSNRMHFALDIKLSPAFCRLLQSSSPLKISLASVIVPSGFPCLMNSTRTISEESR